MKGSPLVSILMNCFNCEKYLKQAIDSIYNQTYQNWEIIFVDNCSSDRSSNIANSYCKKLKYYKLNKNLTLYSARNLGLQHVSGLFLTFLDTDDFWMCNKLMEQVGLMLQNPNVVLAHASYYELNMATSRKKEYIKYKDTGLLKFEDYLKSYTINLQTVMINTVLLKSQELKFNENLNLTGDYELFMRLVYKYPSFYLRDCLSTSRIHDENLSKKLNKDGAIELKIANQNIINIMSNKDKSSYGSYLENFAAKKEFFIQLSLGNRFLARKILRPHILFNYKNFIFYISTYSYYLSQKLLVVKNNFR